MGGKALRRPFFRFGDVGSKARKLPSSQFPRNRGACGQFYCKCHDASRVPGTSGRSHDKRDHAHDNNMETPSIKACTFKVLIQQCKHVELVVDLETGRTVQVGRYLRACSASANYVLTKDHWTLSWVFYRGIMLYVAFLKGASTESIPKIGKQTILVGLVVREIVQSLHG